MFTFVNDVFKVHVVESAGQLLFFCKVFLGEEERGAVVCVGPSSLLRNTKGRGGPLVSIPPIDTNGGCIDRHSPPSFPSFQPWCHHSGMGFAKL